MEIIVFTGIFIVAYLLGSIPTSVWVGKKFYGIDVREHGSGNAGATNTLRVLGWKAGLPVFIIDGLKGFVAASLVMFTSFQSGTNGYVNFQLILGFAALLGHVFPVFAGFRGGKGVATLLGVVIALTPLPAALAFIVFVIVLLIFKYVSIGSMVAGISYPLMIFFVFIHSPFSLKMASVIMAIALIVTHKKNIKRLLKGEESKASFLFNKKKA
jgi:acyl phosphate:glycerol-3-phosphate acyltransferase